jgi:hypothetical protein
MLLATVWTYCYSTEQEEAVAKGCAFQCELLSDPALCGVLAYGSISLHSATLQLQYAMGSTSYAASSPKMQVLLHEVDHLDLITE